MVRTRYYSFRAMMLVVSALVLALLLVFGGEQTAGAQSKEVPKQGTASVAWGDNTQGQLGDGSSLKGGSSSSTPVKTSGLTALKDIAGGANHALAVAGSQSEVWAWGDDAEGQLGDDSTLTDRRMPVEVSGLSGVTNVAAGGKHSLAVWGSSGAVLSWGDNVYGQLGDSTNNDRSTPVQVQGSDGPSGVLTGVKDVAAGANHSLALKNDGTVLAWGSNGAGQLGTGSTSLSSHSAPLQVKGHGIESFLTGVVAVAAGDNHSLALKNDGTVWAWGDNSFGQLGNGFTDSSTNISSSTPVKVSDLFGVTDVAGGGTHSLALKSDGKVWTWGSDADSQLGNDSTDTFSRTPVQVAGLTTMTDVAGGGKHSLASKNDGTVWAWGQNFYGQLGDTTSTERPTPVQVKGEGPGGFLNDVAAVAGGGTHSMAMLRDATPPTTKATPSPQPNAAGWHNANVTLSLSASDGNFGTGVREIKYSAAGAQQIAEQTVQGSSATLPAITAEGETTVTYYAVDKVSNTEARKTFTIKLDKSAPTTSATAKDSAGNSYASGTGTSKDVTVELSAADGTSGSGAKEIAYSINGGPTQTYDPTQKVAVGSEGESTISYYATDEAGNQESPAKTFTVNIDKSAPTLDTANTDSVEPDNRATGVSRQAQPTATFSDEMDPATLTTSTAKLYQWNAKKKKWKPVPVAVSVEGKTATLDPYPEEPTRLLGAKKKYKVTVTTGAKNLVGLPLESTKSWTFTTGVS